MTDSDRPLPSLSVIIPTLGRNQCLLDTVRYLSVQDYPDWECLVVCQGDNCTRLAEQLTEILPGQLRLFHLAEPNASLARNIGLLEARGEVALFLDDDVLIESTDFLSKHGRNYLFRDCSGVVGQVLSPERLHRTTRHWMSYLRRNGWLYFPRNFTKRVPIRNGVSCNLSVRRQQALNIGGMDAQFEKGAHREESDFCLRYTDRFGLMVFDPEITLVHLGERRGGCRAWGVSAGVHPRHHVAGEWYFISRGLQCGTIKLLDVPHHIGALIRRQILNRPNLHSLGQIFVALRRTLEGLRDARTKLSSGPRYANSVGRDDYREISVAGTCTKLCVQDRYE